MNLKKLFSLFLIFATTMFAQEDMQTFLSLKNTGVAEFLSKNPKYDGRGTIIYIFDTGVDQGIEGLAKLPNGETKVIDVQDFTGQGDVHFYEADIEEMDYNGKEDVPCFVNEDKDYKIAGANNLSMKAIDGKYFIGLLPEVLWKNSGAGTKDINGNGKEDDKFYFVTFKTEEDGKQFWVVYFDKDYNGDISDNQPLRNYKEKQQSFAIPNEKGLPNLTMGLNIFPEEKRVSFHFDDGGHGTHCAGIAAGYKIDTGDLNGVAPGAYVGSCKLGNNNYAGGSTVTESMKKCFLYVDKISKERNEPIIVNMSFGVGSAIEGHSEMEHFINELAKKNPYIYLCTSNGNEGPGISTTGLPACSPYIFASGAVLAKEVAEDVYGCTLDRDAILSFSSRGGEVLKPDVIAPGACASTVPNWNGHDVLWGTSMASPYSTGVVSLLLSAAKQEFPDVKIPSLFLYKVIRESATHWKQYDHIDQGSGYVNVVKAWELLKKYIKNNEIKNFENYSVTTMAPNMPYGSASNLYIRNGAFITKTSTFNFVVKRTNFIKKDKFYRAYKVVSENSWLKPIQKHVYIKNNQQAVISVKLDLDKMKDAGMYNGKIRVYRKGTNILEFEMMATIIFPTEFGTENNYSYLWKEKVAPVMFKRHFVNVPAGASIMKVTLSSKSGKYASSRLMIHDPDGVQFSGFPVLSENNNFERYYSNLTPGIYELITTGYFRAKDTSYYSLKVDFMSLERIANKTITPKNNVVKIINNFNKVENYMIKGKVEGYKKTYKVDFDSTDYHKIDFTLKKGESKKMFYIKISKEDYNKTTDFPIEIYNKEGEAVVKEGLSADGSSISIRRKPNEERVEYNLSIRPAFANKPGKIRLYVEEVTYFDDEETFRIKTDMRGTFYPSILTELECDIRKPKTEYPEGTEPFGTIYFEKGKNTVYKLPIDFKF